MSCSVTSSTANLCVEVRDRVEQNPYKNCSVVMCCWVTSSTGNLCVEVRNRVEQNPYKNCSFVMCCSITSSTANLCVKVTSRVEQDHVQNSSSVMCPSVTSSTTSLCVEVRDRREQNPNRTVLLQCVAQSHHQGETFVSKWGTAGNNTLVELFICNVVLSHIINGKSLCGNER